MSDVVKAVLHCKTCGEPIGELDSDEIIYVMLLGIDHLSCFGCSNGWADMIPPFLAGLEEGDYLGLGDDGLMLQDGQLQQAPEYLLKPSLHGVLSCLSSSTYLHGLTPKSTLQGLENEAYCCPGCGGVGLVWDNGGYVQCGHCQGTKWVVRTIKLPVWLVGQGVTSGQC